MPFRQPSSTTIRSYHFRGQVYTFPVESTLGPSEGSGQLVIDVSPGYLLLTSAETTPKSRQSLNYVPQSDGSTVARATVTLLATGPAITSGTITLRDPTDDVLVLNVAVEAQLFISCSAITFPQSESGEAVSVNLKISQQGAHTPVVLSTDDPLQFALAASGTNLHYSPNLTIIPAFEGSYIYVRYTRNLVGRHTAHLSIETPYTTRTLPLHGQAGSLLSLLRLPQWSVRQPIDATLVSQSRSRSGQKVGPLILSILVGLVSLAYIYWYQSGTSRYHLQRAIEPKVTLSVSPKVSGCVSASGSSVNKYVYASAERDTADQDTNQSTKLNDLASQQTPPTIEKEAVTKLTKLNGNNLPKPSHSIRKRQRRLLRLAPATVSDEESDLEKELNKKVNR